MNLQKIFGILELGIGIILMLGVVIGSYFVFSAIPSNLASKVDNLIGATANSTGFEENVNKVIQPFKKTVPLFIYSIGGSYLLIFLLLGILFTLQGILNIREE